MSNYNPKPLDVRVIYIAVDHGPGKWKRVSPNLKVVKMAGTHYTPNVPRIAEVLNAHLAPDHQ